MYTTSSPSLLPHSGLLTLYQFEAERHLVSFFLLGCNERPLNDHGLLYDLLWRDSKLELKGTDERKEKSLHPAKKKKTRLFSKRDTCMATFFFLHLLNQRESIPDTCPRTAKERKHIPPYTRNSRNGFRQL
jgi:hypothetical protein